MNIAIVLASGTGSRFKSEIPKQFLKLAGKMVIEHTFDAFEKHAEIDEIIVVCRPEHRLLMEEVISRGGYRKIRRIVRGGNTRSDSSASGIAAVEGDQHKVLVHDAARPLVDAATIERCLRALDDCQAVDTGIPAGDTIVQIDDQEAIKQIPDRSTLRLGQTPQAFRSGLLRQAHARAMADSKKPGVTDDCGLVLHYGLAKVKVVSGDVNNIKVTYPSDIYLADRLFQLRARREMDCFDTEELDGKVLVVFGSSRGIGERIATIAASHGSKVVGVSRQSGVDVTDAEAVRFTFEQAVAKYGHVDMVADRKSVV